MADTEYETKIIKSDMETPVEQHIIDDSFFVEDKNKPYLVSQIILSGKYNRIYNVVTYFITLNDDLVIVDGDILVFAVFTQFVIVDLKQDKLIRTVKPENGQIFGIYKFKSGYFLRGETANCFLDKDFNIVWENGCIDIFVNFKTERDFEIHEDYITAYDWYGYKHYYNERGEFKEEYYLCYDCNK